MQVFAIVLLVCIISAHAWERRDVSHLEGDDHGGHGKATSYQSNVLHSFHPVHVYAKETHHGGVGYEDGGEGTL